MPHAKGPDDRSSGESQMCPGVDEASLPGTTWDRDLLLYERPVETAGVQSLAYLGSISRGATTTKRQPARRFTKSSEQVPLIPARMSLV